MGKKNKQITEMLKSAYTLANQGNYPEAVKIIRETLDIDPLYPEARFSLGVIYILLDDKKMAVKQCEALEFLDPDLMHRLSEHINQN
jgi:tetratricopeptide (TPR) repeat protein